jgi:hypothetical protein
MEDPTMRQIEALENIAMQLAELRLLKEYELGVVVDYDPDPVVRVIAEDEE